EFSSSVGTSSQVPDPQAPETHARSIIDLSLGEGGRHGEVRRWYRALITLRREHPELVDKSRCATVVDEDAGAIAFVHDERIAVAASLRGVPARLELPRGRWRLALDAGDFGGPTGAAVDGGVVSLP